MKISAVLLAGGESKRMGQDKATLLLDGKPLWRRQLDLLQDLRPAEILVSARTDPEWRPPQTKFAADSPPSQGPLSGLVAAMAAVTEMQLLVLAVDMPFVTRAILERMVALTNSGCGVLPCIGSRAEPVAAIYPRESFSHLSNALSSGELSLQKVAGRLVRDGLLTAMQVPETEEHYYRSLNTPADLPPAQLRHSNFLTGKMFNKGKLNGGE